MKSTLKTWMVLVLVSLFMSCHSKLQREIYNSTFYIVSSPQFVGINAFEFKRKTFLFKDNRFLIESPERSKNILGSKGFFRIANNELILQATELTCCDKFIDAVNNPLPIDTTTSTLRFRQRIPTFEGCNYKGYSTDGLDAVKIKTMGFGYDTLQISIEKGSPVLLFGGLKYTKGEKRRR